MSGKNVWELWNGMLGRFIEKGEKMLRNRNTVTDEKFDKTKYRVKVCHDNLFCVVDENDFAVFYGEKTDCEWFLDLEDNS
jgi:hypothetical protein